MSPVRKEALMRLGSVAISIAIIYLIRDYHKPVSYIAVILVWFILYHFVHFIRRSPDLINDLFPLDSGQLNQNSSINKAIYYSSTAFLLVALVVCICEVTVMGNTVHGSNVFLRYALLGIIIYIGLIVLLKWKFPDVFYDSSRRFIIYLANLISLFIIVPSIACFINITWADPNVKCQIYHINKKEWSQSRRSIAYYLWITVDGQEERFQVTKEEYDMLQTGGNVQLCIQHGKLGYDFVSKFLPAQ